MKMMMAKIQILAVVKGVKHEGDQAHKLYINVAAAIINLGKCRFRGDMVIVLVQLEDILNPTKRNQPKTTASPCCQVATCLLLELVQKN